MLERSLSRSAYVDEDVWAREVDAIWRSSWMCVGRDDEVGDAPGSYRLVELQGEHVLMVRDEDGALRAFVNLCRHRGAELVDSTDPPACTGAFDGSILCPYHHWSYAFDGGLRHAPHLGAEVIRDEHGLIRLELDAWGGFVFVRQGSDAPMTMSLTEQIGPVAARLANYPLSSLRIAASIRYDVAANWKVLAENYNECYHCGPVHPELCDLVPSFRRGGGDQLDWERGIAHRPGAYTFTASGVSNRAPFAGLNDDELVNHKGELVFPNLMISLSCDHVAAFTLWPDGPARTIVVCDFLFHPDQIAADDFDPSDAVEFWDMVNRQDWAICARVQRGMTSRRFTSGLFAAMEDPSLDIRRWWRERMDDRP